MGLSHYYSLMIQEIGGNSTEDDEANIALSRLAQYLLEFSKILGHKEKVRFKSIKKGSTLAIAEVLDPNTKDSIDARISFVDSWSSGSQLQDRFPEPIAAINRLKKMLAEDKSAGTIGSSKYPEEFDFEPLLILSDEDVTELGPYEQQGTLDGFIVLLGHSPHTPDIPVHLQSRSGGKYLCRATRDLGFQMARHPHGTYLRVSGKGEWKREFGGVWRVRKFMIKSYEVLSTTDSFKDVLARMRETKFIKDLSKMEDPAGYLLRLRHGD